MYPQQSLASTELGEGVVSTSSLLFVLVGSRMLAIFLLSCRVTDLLFVYVRSVFLELELLTVLYLVIIINGSWTLGKGITSTYLKRP
jgi:uncharacterized membrane protein YqjE